MSSVIYRKRWELIFLVKHSKGPQMTVQAAAKYLRESRGWAYNVLKIYQETGNVDFSHKKGGKKATSEEQDLEMVDLATADKPKTTVEIARILTTKGTHISRFTVSRRLREHNVRLKYILTSFCRLI